MRLPAWIGKSQKGLWALFLVTLPVTSYPFFPGFMGESVQVRPLSLYPLFVLMILVTLPRLFTQRVPRTAIPFIIFVLVALVSTAYAFTRGIYPPINVSVQGRVLRTLLTLAIGGMFYFTVTLFPQKRDELRFTLTWLYVGFAIALLWASFQIIYVIRFDRSYFNLLNEVQKLVSTRKLFDKRISGMTYEPSWFAEQLTLVLMPFLFASVLSKYSVFKWRFRWLTAEMVLLGWSALGLLFTYSRGGLAVFVVLSLISLLIGVRTGIVQKENRWRRWFKLFLQFGFVLVIFCVVIFAVAQKNNYFSRLWEYWTDEESEGTYFYYIAFSQRITYWETAFRIFEDHTGLGIGLGNFTFYFDEYLPDRQYRNPELLLKLVPEKGRNQVVTVKNFFVRLLAETGILGASAFTAFLVAVSGCVLYLLLSGESEGKFWGRAGLLGLISFLPVTLSIDSFAIPNMWVVFGLITASSAVFIKPSQEGHSVHENGVDTCQTAGEYPEEMLHETTQLVA
jgi:hypothetical protein